MKGLPLKLIVAGRWEGWINENKTVINNGYVTRVRYANTAVLY